MIFPKIPTRIYGSGDLDRAGELIGFSRKLLGDLVNGMKFQTGEKTHPLADGSVITVRMNYGVSTIHITSPVVLQPDVEEESIECFCSPCFTFGEIVRESVDEDGRIKVQNEEWLGGESKLYDVLVCDESGYVLLLDVPATNWSMAYEGQWVLVSLKFNNESHYDNVHGKEGFSTVKCVLEINSIEGVSVDYQITPIMVTDKDKWVLLQS